MPCNQKNRKKTERKFFNNNNQRRSAFSSRGSMVLAMLAMLALLTAVLCSNPLPLQVAQEDLLKVDGKGRQATPLLMIPLTGRERDPTPKTKHQQAQYEDQDQVDQVYKGQYRQSYTVLAVYPDLVF